MEDNIVIEVNDLHVRYGRGTRAVSALRGIDLAVHTGERVAIIGRSGGGKSSLLQVLSGLLSPTEGNVSIGNHRLKPDTQPPSTLYNDVGLVFQNYGLVPQLTALENVLCGGLQGRTLIPSLAGFSASEKDRAARILQDFGLGNRIHTRSSRLSGGEQQRVGIARLLYKEPPILLLDEPVASLDIHWANHAIESICSSTQGNATVVMVLHDLWMVRQFADRVIFLDQGRVAFDGDPEEGCRLLEAQQVAAGPPNADGAVDPPRSPSPEDFAPGAAPESSPAASDSPALTNPSPSRPEMGSLDRGLMQRGPLYAALLLAALLLYGWAAAGVDFSLSRVFGNLDNALDFLQRMFPPNFSAAAPVATSLLETIQMALIGTSLAAIISLPIAVMAARNIASRPLQALARLVLNMLRTVPSIIWGLFFVVIVGLGPFAGVLALTFYASGYLGKFYYEAIEAIDPRPLQSLRSVGASPLQRFRWGVFPQVLPLILGYTLYMFEYNVRAASILGIVGAGGIGYYLNMYVSFAQYDNAATALLLLLAVVTIIDSFSSYLRARLID